MGSTEKVVDLATVRRAHAEALSGAVKKSSGVTAPPVSEAIRSATFLDGQPVPSHKQVTQPLDTPMRAAKSRRRMRFSDSQSASFMEPTFSSSKISAQAKILVPLHGPAMDLGKDTEMTDSPPSRPFEPTLIRKWRKHRKQTLEQLAEASNMSPGNLSNIERGVTGYNQETLESLARALDVHPAELLMRDPGQPTPLWKLWDEATPAQQKQIIGIIEGLLRSSAA